MRTLSLKFVLLAVVFAGIILPASVSFAQQSKADERAPITQKLIKLMDKNPEIMDMLKTSIAEAKKANPDIKTNPVQSLDEYFDFVDKATQLIPQEMLNKPADLVRDQILQSICYFYFLVDQPITQLKGKGQFKPSLQYYEPFSGWLRDFAVSWGTFLNTQKSWSDKTYREFFEDKRFGLQKDWYEPSSNWDTFNRFFSRYLKDPKVRPIADPKDDAIVVSPADSVPQGTWAIDKKSNISVPGGLKVKMATYYNVNELLAKDSKYKNKFAGGTLTHSFLNVNDYHRYHFGVGGKVVEKKIIQQNVALEVAWDKKTKKYVPIDSTGWQFTQTRGYVVMDTGKYGLVVLMPMGMAHVSSVNFEDTVTEGSTHAKGDMLGTFLFGGSDFIMIFQKKAGFEITVPVHESAVPESQVKNVHATTIYKHLLMGNKYGFMKGKAK